MISSSSSAMEASSSSRQEVTATRSAPPEQQIAEARAAGQARKEEAIRRREEFVIKQSEAKLVSSKSVQQLNAEREEMIAREVAKIQAESRKMMERYMDESKKRAEMLEQGPNSIEKIFASILIPLHVKTTPYSQFPQ